MEKSRRKQLVVKIFCLIASFCLWLYITNYENPIKTYRLKNVTVQVTNQDYLKQNNFVLVPNQNFSVTLTLRGNSEELYGVKTDDFKLVADLSSYALKKGINRIPVKIERSPDNINVVQTEGLWVDVDIDEYAQKTVAVKTNVEGRPLGGLYSYEPSVSPQNVTISGPARDVKLVNHVEVNVNIKNLSSDADLKVKAQAIDDKGNLLSDVKVQPNLIEVKVPIRKAKNVPINVKTSGQLPKGLSIISITPDQASVDIMGSKSELEKVNSIDTENIDLSKITGDTEIKVNLVAPDKISFVGNDDGKITVKIKTQSVTSSSSAVNNQNFNVNITYNNLGTGLKAQLSSGTASVVVSGGNNISSSDVKAAVDLNNLAEGTYTLPVNLTLPPNVKTVSQNPEKITVVISKQ
ncbi:CdaR family protein [Clostridium hydrogenum]|uniref:CdaR family protein n=1 Tax=Clostridium hydrogenum TaxID=2855764 RepID=UPI001F333EA9|nr:CdaR family protein [Clostridium hydrogenum]